MADSKGIGGVTCVYINPDTDQFWLIASRIDALDGDCNSQLDHVRAMLTHVVSHKQLSCQAGLMDTWDATKALLLFSESCHQLYSGPLKDNRQVDAASGAHPCRRGDALAWSRPWDRVLAICANVASLDRATSRCSGQNIAINASFRKSLAAHPYVSRRDAPSWPEFPNIIFGKVPLVISSKA